jgi:aminopeptidase-like protein
MVGGPADSGVNEMAMLWVLNQSDGSKSLLDIAERSGMKFEVIRKAAEALEQHQLLKKDFKSVTQAAR